MRDELWSRVACGIECCMVRSSATDELEVRGRTMAREGETRHYAIELVPVDAGTDVIATAIKRVVAAIQKAVQ